LTKSSESQIGHLWVSDGSGNFEISDVENPGIERGT